MNTRSITRLTILVVATALLAGCSSGLNDDHISPGNSLQLRLVTSSSTGKCTAPVLTSDGPGSACDNAGKITYELGKVLGVIAPTSVVLPKGQGSGPRVILTFDKADSSILNSISDGAVNKQLATLLDGRVLSAPNVMEPYTTNELSLVFGDASEAKQVAADLMASVTS